MGTEVLQLRLTWKRFVLLKNMKLILEMDDLSASLRVLLVSREAGRVTCPRGLALSDSKSI